MAITLINGGGRQGDLAVGNAPWAVLGNKDHHDAPIFKALIRKEAEKSGAVRIQLAGLATLRKAKAEFEVHGYSQDELDALCDLGDEVLAGKLVKAATVARAAYNRR